MPSILIFESEHGPIYFEVDETAVATGGSDPMSKTMQANETKSDTRFEKAMASLTAYASSLQGLVEGLDVKPTKVEVEVGLKLRAEGNFFAIAKAGTDAETRVKLTWEPGKGQSV